MRITSQVEYLTRHGKILYENPKIVRNNPWKTSATKIPRDKKTWLPHATSWPPYCLTVIMKGLKHTSCISHRFFTSCIHILPCHGVCSESNIVFNFPRSGCCWLHCSTQCSVNRQPAVSKRRVSAVISYWGKTPCTFPSHLYFIIVCPAWLTATLYINDRALTSNVFGNFIWCLKVSDVFAATLFILLLPSST